MFKHYTIQHSSEAKSRNMREKPLCLSAFNAKASQEWHSTLNLKHPKPS